MNKSEIGLDTIRLAIDMNHVKRMVQNYFEDQCAKVVANEVASALTIATKNPKNKEHVQCFGHHDHFGDITAIISERMDVALYSDEVQKMADAYIAEQFPKVLKAALDVAIEHKARRVAWDTIKHMDLPKVE